MTFDFANWIARAVCAAVLVLLLALAGEVADVGIASIYFNKVAEELKTLRPGKDVEQYRQALSGLKGKLDKARGLVPLRPEYVLMNDSILSQLGKAVPGGTTQLGRQQDIVSTLAVAPTNARLWARLAVLRFRQQGASEATMQALDMALLYGPYEDDALLANAAIVLYGWDNLDGKRRQSGWEVVIRAASMPRLSGAVMGIARQTGHGDLLANMLQHRRQQGES